MTTTKWVEETPTEEGWYCPCYVTIFRGGNLVGNVVHTARNDTFIEGPNHGGWGLKYNGKPCPMNGMTPRRMRLLIKEFLVGDLSERRIGRCLEPCLEAPDDELKS